jgi:RNA polymerase sigma-70 factor (ECF subfamily)
MFKNQTDAKLLAQIQADNMLAFDELYVRYRRKLFHFANCILKSDGDAENIVHEVYIKLWENRKKIEKIKSYIFSIAYNSSISLIRKKINDQKFLDYIKSLPPSWEAPADLDIEYKDLVEKAEQIIEKLPKQQKSVYLLSREDGMLYSEIAERMNISINTVENHMVSALRTIRLELGKISLSGFLLAMLFSLLSPFVTEFFYFQ